MKITDQAQTGDVLVSFVEGDDGRSYIHWLSLQGGNAMVFVVVSDESICNRIHSFVLRSAAQRSDSNVDAPAQGVSFSIN